MSNKHKKYMFHVKHCENMGIYVEISYIYKRIMFATRKKQCIISALELKGIKNGSNKRVEKNYVSRETLTKICLKQ